MNRKTILKGSDAIRDYHDRSSMRSSQLDSLNDSQETMSEPLTQKSDDMTNLNPSSSIPIACHKNIHLGFDHSPLYFFKSLSAEQNLLPTPCEEERVPTKSLI